MNSNTFKASLTGPATLLALMLVCHGCPVSGDDTPPVEASQTTPEKHLLRYQFHVGDVLRYRSTQTVTQQAAAPAGQKVDVSKVEQKRMFRISEVREDGDVIASMQFEHVRMELRTDDGEPTVFDSSMSPSEVPARFKGTAEQLKGAAPRFTLRTDGTPVSPDGVQQMPKGGQACFMIPLPRDAVSIGESWKVNMPVHIRHAAGVMRQVTLLRSYKLASVQDGIARIDFFTSMDSSIRSPQAKGQLLHATPNGRIDFDIANGRVIRREMKTDRSVLGALGPGSILTAQGYTVEELLSDDEPESKVTAR